MFNFLKKRKEPNNYFSETLNFTIDNWVSFEYPKEFEETEERDPDDNSILYQFYSQKSDFEPVVQISSFPSENSPYNEEDEKNSLQKIFGLLATTKKINGNDFLFAQNNKEGRIFSVIVAGKNNSKVFITIIYPDNGYGYYDTFINDFLERIKFN